MAPRTKIQADLNADLFFISALSRSRAPNRVVTPSVSAQGSVQLNPTTPHLSAEDASDPLSARKSPRTSVHAAIAPRTAARAPPTARATVVADADFLVSRGRRYPPAPCDAERATVQAPRPTEGASGARSAFARRPAVNFCQRTFVCRVRLIGRGVLPASVALAS